MGSVACSAVIQVPVTVETKGSCGAESRTPRTRSAKAGTAGSIIGEWNACDVWSGRQITFSSSSRFWTRATASAGPATTHRPGAFSEAIARLGSSRNRRAASPAMLTESIAPGGSAPMRRPRSATSLAASSRAMTPASAAQTNSPTLWPTIATGSIPQCFHWQASAHSMANSAGCV